jgi:hypothetical protein
VSAYDKLTLPKILLTIKHYFFGCCAPVLGVVVVGLFAAGVAVVALVEAGDAVGSVGTEFGSTVLSICLWILDLC